MFAYFTKRDFKRILLNGFFHRYLFIIINILVERGDIEMFQPRLTGYC